MSNIGARRMEYHDRFGLQQADQAIRKDIVRALVEMITNSNDSYYRLENGNQHVRGKIIVDILRKRKNSIIRVRDYAEGMSSRTMNEKVGTYGAPTSGFLDGKSVRGMWGRGLKDSFYGIGGGEVISIRNNKLYVAKLYIENGAPMYLPPTEGGKEVTAEMREKYQILEGNGTIMQLAVSRPDVPMPRVESLRFKLQQHFELRTIMNDPDRDIYLREIDSKGRIKQEHSLSYHNPTGIRIFNESFYVPGFKKLAHLEIYRSDEPLTTVSEVGDFADGGLLVISKRVVMAITLLKFNHNEYANRIYGSITCDYMHDLLMQEDAEPILTATRDGLNWDHSFMKALKEEIEIKLEPLIMAERRLAQASATIVVDKQLRKRFNSALKHLNSMANLILVGEKKPVGEKKKPIVPFNNFGFINKSITIQPGKLTTLTLRSVINQNIKPEDIIEVTSSNDSIRVLKPYAILQLREDFPDIGEVKIEVEGFQVGADAILQANLHGQKSEIALKVVSKNPAISIERKRGFITDIEFSPTGDPRQRAVFDRMTAKIVISTTAPSVSQYLGENGAGANTPQGQVLLAELVTDVLCREIARVGVLNGKLPSFHDNLEESVQAHYQRLVHEFAHEVHAFFVDKKYRRLIESEQK